MSISTSSSTTTSDNLTPDTFRLYSVKLTNYAGETIDIGELIQEFTIEESLFLMSCVFEFTIADAVNLIDKFKITGNEQIQVVLRKKNKEGASDEEVKKDLYFAKINQFARPTPNAQTYKLKAISEYGYIAKSKRLSRSFSGKATDIISNIYSSVGGELQVLDNQSDGNLTVVMPNYTVFDSIAWMLQKTAKNNGSPFFVYDTAKDGAYLNSYENIISTDPYEKYLHAYTFNNKTYSEEDFKQRRVRIQSVSSDLGFSTFTGFSEGAYTARTHKLDYAQKSYTTSDFNLFDSDVPTIDKSPILDSNFLVGEESASTLKDPKNFYMNVNSYSYKDSNVQNVYQSYTDQIAKRNSILVNLNQLTHTITLRGDFNLQPGKMIEIDLPKATDPKAGEDGTRDDLLSGKYLVVGTKHRFAKDGYKVDLKLKKDSIKR